MIDGCLRPECAAERSLLLHAPSPRDDGEWNAKGGVATCCACGAAHLVVTASPVLTLGRGDLRLALSEPERAVELVGMINGKRAAVWACSVCMMAARSPEAAEKCCAPKVCDRCGAARDLPHWVICRACRRAEADERLQARIDKAVRVPLAEYDHAYVWLEGQDQGMLVDEWVDLPADERPEIAWACEDLGTPKLDAVNLLDDALSDYHEDAMEDFDVDALQKVLDDYMATQKSGAYQVLHDCIVVLGEEGSGAG